MTKTLTITISVYSGREWTPVKPGTHSQGGFADLEECQRFYTACRDRWGLGGSQLGNGMVTDAEGNHVARISYNGRVWEAKEWQPGDTPIMEAPSPFDIQAKAA